MTSHKNLVPSRNVPNHSKGRKKEEDDFRDVEIDDLDTPQPLTTLKLMKDIKDLKLIDLKMDYDSGITNCKAVTFTKNERLYSNLIDLNANAPCIQGSQKQITYKVVKDYAPLMEEFLGYQSLPEYSFQRKAIPLPSDLPSTSDGHSLHNMKQKWKRSVI